MLWGLQQTLYLQQKGFRSLFVLVRRVHVVALSILVKFIHRDDGVFMFRVSVQDILETLT